MTAPNSMDDAAARSLCGSASASNPTYAAHNDDKADCKPVQGLTIHERLQAVDWIRVDHALDQFGNAPVRNLATRAECEALAALYRHDDLFRSTVVMARHGFGRGEYRYFAYPLPNFVATLRESMYPRLVAIANRWNTAMRIDVRFPERHADFIARCHTAGQSKPTPLLLEYREGDFNCLHQDLYGEHVFPLQVALLLSRPAHDFTGGEFVLTEQRPRQQSRVDVVRLQQGDAVILAVNDRPVQGTRGFHRVRMRHGVSRLHSGLRHTAGIIFHDAR
jgi:hypothetical protein